MFRINDYIMYGLIGICKVKDIEKVKDRDNLEKEYYILNPIDDENTIIKIPTENKNIRMRPILSKEQAGLLIKGMPEMEIAWIENERERSHDFNISLKSGKCEEWAKLIKIINLKRKEKKLEGKKINLADENIMKAAEKLLNEELGMVLDISPKEVNAYILKKLS